MTPLFTPVDGPGTLQGLCVEPEEARSILRPQRDDRHGFGFALSPYRGCAHGCRYCYVREYPNALHGPEDWGAWVTPKLNAPELLWSQRHRLHRARVFMASATDPYQPLEARYRLSRACLKVLLRCPTTEVLLYTRSPLLLQDLDLLKAFGERLSVGISLPTDDEAVRRVVEPKAPSVRSRLHTAERLSAAGVGVTFAITPLMAVRDPRAFAKATRDTGARQAWVGGLRLLHRDPFYRLLEEHGWLRVLDKTYVGEVREAFRRAFPRLKPEAQDLPESTADAPRLVALQPGLFEPDTPRALWETEGP